MPRTLKRHSAHVPYVNDLVLKFGPSLAGLLLTWVVAGRSGLGPLLRRLVNRRASATQFLIAVAIPPATFIGALLLRGYATALSAVSLDRALGVFSVQLAINTLLGGGLREELGWRGFLMPHLSKRHSPFAASLIVAAAWFAWHSPGYLLTSKAEADPILPFAVIVFPLSVVLTWLYYRASDNLLLPVLMHASLNATSYAMLILIPQVAQSPTFQPTNGWVLAGIWIVLALLVLASSGNQLGRNVVSNHTETRA